MGLSKTEIDSFQCQSKSGCIMKGTRDFWDAYSLDGTKLLFNGEVIGDLSEKSLAEMLCYEHCHGRYFDEVLGAPVKKKPFLKVVSRYSKPVERFVIEGDVDGSA